VSFFGFRDDSERAGFQAALQRLDGSDRPAAEAVRAAIADASGGCKDTVTQWRPATSIIESSASVRNGAGWAQTVRLRAGEDALAHVCTSVMRPAAVSERVPGLRCRSITLVGLRPRDVPFVVLGAGVFDMTVEFTAEANVARRTTVVIRGVKGLPRGA
jgi:hypothetical protein